MKGTNIRDTLDDGSGGDGGSGKWRGWLMTNVLECRTSEMMMIMDDPKN